MKTNIILILFLGVSLCCYSQNAVDESILESEQAMKEAVAKYYYENFGIEDFFQKYPDYPRYVNTGDTNHGPHDYEERIIKYLSKHSDLIRLLEDMPEYETTLKMLLDPRVKKFIEEQEANPDNKTDFKVLLENFVQELYGVR